jgi:RHS repeat-associated protein
MNPFRTSKKTQDFKAQHHYYINLTCRVCLQNTSDYSPFGVSLDGRTVESEFYRRGFNGMEKEDEFKGKGNSYTTEFRQLDPRLGRWMTIDPLIARFPWQSSYTTFDNNPILLIDPSGLASETIEGEPEKTDPNSPEPKYHREVIVKMESRKTRVQKIWNRVWGGIETFFGTLEASIGAGLIASGAGSPLGIIMFAHGADHAAAGAMQMITGKKQNSLTYKSSRVIAESLGAESGTAKNIANTVDFTIGILTAANAMSTAINGERKIVQKSMNLAEDLSIKFGNIENQVNHTFRHTDALGLERSLVQTTVQSHFKTVSSQVVARKPFNQIIEIGGKKFQYTAYKLDDGTFNIGRIHDVK